MRRIHVIIVTYNGINWIDKCLNSVLNSDLQLSVILIDNRSSDGTLNFVRDKYPDVTAIDAEDNLGFGKANNIGIQMAILDSTEGVFLLNQDAYVEKNTISRLVNIGSHCQEAGIISPIHFNGDGTAHDIGFQNMFKLALPIVLPNVQFDAVSAWEVPFVNAAAWYVPRRALLEVGGFDPIFTHYGEDNDYVNRLKYFQFKIIVIDDVKVYHDRLQISSQNARSNFKKYAHGTFVNYLCLAKKPGDSLILSLVKLFSFCVLNSLKELFAFNFKYVPMHVKHLVMSLKMFKTLHRQKLITRRSGAFINI